MSFYFISDNSYFIEGLKLSLTGNDFDKNSIYVNISEDDFYFHPGKDDIVVLAVANINVRRKILKTPEIALCKLAIMGRAKTLGMLKGVFLPWFFSREMTSRELANALIHIKNHKFTLHQFSDREAEVFFYLGAGFSHEEVAGMMGFSSKYIYALRRKVNTSMGLLDCNCATGILLCRDIAEMFMFSKRKTVPNRFNFGTNVAFY